MITAPKKPRQAKSKPRSVVRLGTAPWGGNPGQVTITAGKLTRDYFLLWAERI
jgi:hypothetical protein